jgi:RNA polymerase sigma-70 factor (ECF subfamily)
MPEATSHTDDPSAAVRRLIDEHGGRVYSLALRFCGDATDAEDLVQDVFLSAFKGWHTFRGESSERTWLYAIAARACQRMRRKRSGEPERVASLDVDLPFDAPLIAAVPGDRGGDVLDQSVRNEARERLEAEIAALPEDFRVPLVLKEIVGLPIADIAAILGLEQATARSRVHRARLKLRDAVDRALPRNPNPAPPPAYPEQTCLDLLAAKQEALDRGVPFESEIICERCRSVFASLDLTQEVCRDLAAENLPAEVRARLEARVATPA